MGFFGGACQGRLGVCGEGGILFIQENHKTGFKAALGEGTNNLAEMNSLWLLLRVAIERGVTQLQIYGDSKFVID